MLQLIKPGLHLAYTHRRKVKWQLIEPSTLGQNFFGSVTKALYDLFILLSVRA